LAVLVLAGGFMAGQILAPGRTEASVTIYFTRTTRTVTCYTMTYETSIYVAEVLHAVVAVATTTIERRDDTEVITFYITVPTGDPFISMLGPVHAYVRAYVTRTRFIPVLNQVTLTETVDLPIIYSIRTVGAPSPDLRFPTILLVSLLIIAAVHLLTRRRRFG